MKNNKISFITTVFNEEKTIRQLLKSLNNQTKRPNEIIIVDGGSTDKTSSKISNFKFLISSKKVKVLTKKGNRSVGRNEAIRKATGNIIVCSDSGNILDKDWVKNIIKPFENTKIDVVAGYYKGRAKNIFQKCVIPYALVMPDKVNFDSFLPATRSVAFTKAIWKKVGGFDERFSHNEDYVFARKLKESGAKIVFAKDAVVNWIPRNTYKQAFIMMFRFALGDAEAKILRPKVIVLFARYIIGLSILGIVLIVKSLFAMLLFFILLAIYIFWSIWKNYRYIKDYRSIIILPLLQFTADIAVITGSIVGASRIFLIRWIATFLFIALLIFLPFKYLRSISPIPKINEEKIVGYAQYYGYPFYFETILFFVFIFLPIVTFLLYSKKLKHDK